MVQDEQMVGAADGCCKHDQALPAIKQAAEIGAPMRGKPADAAAAQARDCMLLVCVRAHTCAPYVCFIHLLNMLEHRSAQPAQQQVLAHCFLDWKSSLGTCNTLFHHNTIRNTQKV
jgi:hypothetical protein